MHVILTSDLKLETYVSLPTRVLRYTEILTKTIHRTVRVEELLFVNFLSKARKRAIC